MLSVPLLLMVLLSAVSGVKDVDNFCGQKLAETLAHWCYKADKRAVDIETDSIDYNEVIWPWLMVTRRDAKAMTLPSRNKRGVIEECCAKPCSMNELLSYCDDD